MAEGAKRAHADLNITVEGPSEELDVVTERPRDLSPAMELEMNRNKSLADALGHLGNIADNANDLNRTINAYDWDVDYKDRADEMKIEQRRMEETAQLNLFNEVSATKVQMMKDVENAKEAARNSGDGNVLAAAQGAMDGYRDAFSDSLEGSKMWSQVFNNTYAHETQYGILSDFEIAQAKAMHNLNQSQNEIFRNVTMGALDVDSGMKKLLVDTGAMKGHIPNQKYVEMMDNNYNQLVIAKALNLSKVANGSNATEIANTIRSLINQYGKKEYACFDNQGKQLTDEQGNPITYTASLTPATIEELLRTAQSYENKASSSGTSGATKSFDEYRERVGGEDIEKNGISDYMISTTPTMAAQDYQRTIQAIQADENATPKQKIAKIKNITEYYYSTVLPAVSAYEAMKLTPDSRANHKKLVQKLNELDAALVSGQSMVDYSMSFDLGNGDTFELKPPIDFSMINMTDPQSASHNIWSTIRDTLKKTVNAETTADFVYGTNEMFTLMVNRSAQAAGRTSLVSTQGEHSWVNKQGVNNLTAELIGTKQAYTDAAGKVGTYSALPKHLTESFAEQYTNCINPKQQSDYTRAFATAMINSGYSGFAISPNALKGKSDSVKQAYAELQKELFLAAPNLSDVRAIVSQSAAQGTGYYTNEAVKDYLDKANLKGTDLTKHMTELLAKHKIPAQYQESLRSAMTNVAAAYATVSLGDGKIDETQIKNALEKIVTQNFIGIDSPYVKDKVYIGNSALLQGSSVKEYAAQAKTMGSLVTQTGNEIKNSLNKIGIDTRGNQLKAEFDTVSGRVMFKLGGQAIGLNSSATGVFNPNISIPYNYMAAKPSTYTAKQWNGAVANYVSTSATLAHIASSAVSTESKLFTDPITKEPLKGVQAKDEAIRMLSVLQKDNFLQSYSNAVSSGGRLGVASAPNYLKETFKTMVEVPKTSFSRTDVSTHDRVYMTPEDVNKILDFAYSKSATHNKVDLTINKPLSYGMRGYNYTGVMTAAHNNGFVIARDYDPQNVPGVTKSSHNKGMALDFGVYSNNMEDPVTGRVKVSAMNNFTNMLNNNAAYKGKVKYVLTSRPELLENKPEYSAYAKYRAMKGADGQPLFKDARHIDKKLLKKNNHSNHFHVEFKEQVVGADHQDFHSAYKAVADDMVNSSAQTNVPLTKRTAVALLAAFGDRYNNKTSTGTFGIANLTDQEYAMLGLSNGSQYDPTLQARAMGNRYQAYVNALGNTDLAVYALAGAKFKGDDGKVVTVQEILNSGKIAGVNGRRYYLAVPMKNGKPDAAEQARQAALMKKYKKAYYAQKR